MSQTNVKTIHGSNLTPMLNKNDISTPKNMFNVVFGTEALLKILIMISGVLFSGVVFLHVGAFSHNDYIQGDIRYQKLKAAELDLSLSDPTVHGAGNYLTGSGPLSNQLMSIGYIAEICLTISLVLGSITYCSITIPKDHLQHNNTKIHAFFLSAAITLCYIFLIAGIFLFFFQIHKCIILTYPHYMSDTSAFPEGMIWNHETETFGDEDFVMHSVNNGIFWYNWLCISCILSIVLGFILNGCSSVINYCM